MPTYEYECTECGYRFEAFQMMSDEPLTECESCGGAVKRLIFGGTGVIFKGSGFYVTDNKGKAKSQPQAAKSADKAKSDEAKADSKPAEKSGTKDASAKTEKKSSEGGKKETVAAK